MRLNFSSKYLAGALATFLVIGAGATLALAQGSGSKGDAAIVTVTLTGSLSGVHAGSGSKSTEGPVFIILVARGAAGEKLEAYSHWKLQLMDGPATRRLLEKHGDGKAVKVRGRLYVDQRILQVVSFSHVDEG